MEVVKINFFSISTLSLQPESTFFFVFKKNSCKFLYNSVKSISEAINHMEKNLRHKKLFFSEEENTLNWEEIQSAFEKNFGSEVYNSWLKSIILIKEYNDFIILGVPTRFFRDWIVSRYLDKILAQVKNLSLA